MDKNNTPKPSKQLATVVGLTTVAALSCSVEGRQLNEYVATTPAVVGATVGTPLVGPAQTHRMCYDTRPVCRSNRDNPPVELRPVLARKRRFFYGAVQLCAVKREVR